MTDRPPEDAILDDETVNGLTGLQWRALASYVRFVADRLELRDWTIVLETEAPPNADAGASIRPVYGRKRAYLRFRDDFMEANPGDQVQTVAHELIHCHLDAIMTPVEDTAISGALGTIAYPIFRASVANGLEHATDALAASFASHMPPIDWTYVQPSIAVHHPPPWALGPWVPDLESAFNVQSRPYDAHVGVDLVDPFAE